MKIVYLVCKLPGNSNLISHEIYSAEEKAIRACVSKHHAYIKWDIDIHPHLQRNNWIYPMVKTAQIVQTSAYLVCKVDEAGNLIYQGIYSTEEKARQACVSKESAYIQWIIDVPLCDQPDEWVCPEDEQIGI